MSGPVPTQTKRFVDDLREAADYVRGVLGEAEVALVLGSGLNGFIDVLEDKKEVPYADIPHMPTTTVKVGCPSAFVSGLPGGVPSACVRSLTRGLPLGSLRPACIRNHRRAQGAWRDR